MDRVDEYRRIIKEILSRHAKIKYLKEGKDMEAIRMQQTIQKKGELTIRNLPVEKGQQIEVLLLFTPSEPAKRPRLTARQLLHSPLIGLWAEREDISDSAGYAQQLREQAQRRS